MSKCLYELTLDLKNYIENGSVFKRTAVRGIVRRGDKYLVIHSKYGDYKFPGGGMEQGESLTDTLCREMEEETGYRVLPDSVSDYILVHEKRKGDPSDLLEMDSYYFFCDVEDQVYERNLDEYEKEYDYQVEWLPLSEVLKRSRAVEDYENIPWIVREMMVMERVRTPKMILFDYGQTLANEAKFNGTGGTAAVLKYATQNKYNLSAGQVQAEAEKMNRELGRFEPRNPQLPIAEVPTHMFTAYLYESLGIKVPLTAEEIDKVFWDAASPAVPTDGVEEFLEFLHQKGIRAGVLSNISYAGKVVENRIHELLPNHHFEFIIATSEYLYRKPNKRIFDLALEKAELSPDEVWYIGDNYDCDVVGARNAGIYPIWYRGAIDRPYEVKEDVRVINDWKELRNELEN